MSEPLPSQRRYDIPIPLPGGKRLIWIAGLFPIASDDWDHLMHVLATMRPGLVAAVPETQANGEQGDGQ